MIKMTTLRDPFQELDRLFNTSHGPAAPAMPLDLYRDGDKFVAKVDLPGVNPASIDIDVEDRTLTISAKREADDKDDRQWLTRERPSGTFARQLTLGYGLSLDAIAADYNGGVLTVTIPIAEENKPRKISVSVGKNADGKIIEN
ncbi:Hsp20/alpha crystallin family protein [Mobiluncus mulieris ATCC 35239]|uniref:Hsp20/alpha crystallin family protein n=2 Tax=Mobiluncus mulieris TaxID=2052 RepID=E0QND7_9ACTO|nr:Hsp20/alpha crystallin family protein [Mobiluncus mulieris ATCC 35239]